MFSRILVPLSLTPSDKDAIQATIQIAKNHGSSVFLLHVIEMIHDTPFDELSEFYHEVEKKARDSLRSAVKLFEAQNIEPEVEVVYGERAKEILSAATVKNASIIIMRSHNLDTTSSKSLGTISQKVGLLAPCSVLLVR